MSTRALIKATDEKNNLMGVYCHSDGYPEGGIGEELLTIIELASKADPNHKNADQKLELRCPNAALETFRFIPFMIRHLKHEYNLYIELPDGEGNFDASWAEYVYEIELSEKNPKITAYDYNGKKFNLKKRISA